VAYSAPWYEVLWWWSTVSHSSAWVATMTLLKIEKSKSFCGHSHHGQWLNMTMVTSQWPAHHCSEMPSFRGGTGHHISLFETNVSNSPLCLRPHHHLQLECCLNFTLGRHSSPSWPVKWVLPRHCLNFRDSQCEQVARQSMAFQLMVLLDSRHTLQVWQPM